MLTLGLDVGANSIGWSLIDHDQRQIIGCGVRVFPEGVDNFDTKKEKPKMETRRVARGMRRQIARRSARKRQLRQLLAKLGLFPADAERQLALLDTDPYALRRRALDEALSLHEFGRLIIHLNQRRGFKSNRKSDRGRKADDKGLLGEINELAGTIKQSEASTLGQYLAKLREDPHTRVRNRHTRRDMLEFEFDACWAAQQTFNLSTLTDEIKRKVRKIIFFQRDMYWPASVVGRCELEPRLPRCPRADRLAQRFRLLQEVNNLRYFDPAAREEMPLSPESRALLLDKLSATDKMDFDKIRKTLGFIESIAFNLERGNRKSMKGMPTDHALAQKHLFGKPWHDLSEERKNEIVRKLIDADDDALPSLAAEWGLPADSVDGLSKVDLPPGYASLSRIALEKLLPSMERGLLYMTDDETPCARTEAGYLRPDQRAAEAFALLPEPPQVANPVVRQALFELRKLVNGIVRENHRKPDRIHIELARNATMSSEDRVKASKRRQENEDRRSNAAGLIRENGFKVSRDGIDRVLLWGEQSEICIYSGRPISLTQLLQGEADIDHILPYSRCLDDSMQNKVVAFRIFNNEKGNRTPREWLESEPDRYNSVLQRAARLNYAKRKRFSQKELELDKFVERQLNDTRYIARTAATYLRSLVDEPHFVLCPKGGHTAELRRHWGLETVLRNLQDSPAWIGRVDLRDGEKDRSDHRHHTIDAIVVALTDGSRLQQLARIKRAGGMRVTGEALPDPWPAFRESVIAGLANINVSHRVQRRVSGALHEDTLYGPVREKTITGELAQRSGEFVVRKPLESLSCSMIEDIRDDAIRNIVIARLKERGVPFGRGVKGGIGKDVWKPQVQMPSGVPIKKVRIIKRDDTIQPIRSGTAFVKPGSMHHLCLFEWTENGKVKRDAVFISTLEAIGRIRRGDPVIQRVHPDRPKARFIMSLSQREMVLLHIGERDLLYRFDTAASTTKQMTFYPHNAAEQHGKLTKYPDSLAKLTPRKVTVDPLGRIRWAND